MFFDVESIDFDLRGTNIPHFVKINKFFDKPWMLTDPFAEKIEIRRAHGGSEEKHPICPKLLSIGHVTSVHPHRLAHGRQAEPEIVECGGGAARFPKRLIVDRKRFINCVGDAKIDCTAQSAFL